MNREELAQVGWAKAAVRLEIITYESLGHIADDLAAYARLCKVVRRTGMTGYPRLPRSSDLRLCGSRPGSWLGDVLKIRCQAQQETPSVVEAEG